MISRGANETGIQRRQGIQWTLEVEIQGTLKKSIAAVGNDVYVSGSGDPERGSIRTTDAIHLWVGVQEDPEGGWTRTTDAIHLWIL
jgi:hypothetical protein